MPATVVDRLTPDRPVLPRHCGDMPLRRRARHRGHAASQRSEHSSLRPLSHAASPDADIHASALPPYRQGPEISLVFKDNLCDVMGLICYLIFSPDTHYNRSIIGNAQIKGL